ncbi:MAG TPA: YkvA family protein [Rhizobium sp.]
MDDVKYGEILLPGEEAETEKKAKKVKAGFWPVFKRAVGYLPFARDVVAAFYCAFDPSTPKRVRAILLGALAYFVLPFDAIPDFLALVGFSDDIAVLAAAIAAVRAHMKPEHFEKADRALASEITSG